jgi:hypothetical protein
MKIVLDRRNCNCWDQACDAHFGSYFLGDEVKPVGCTVEMSDDGKDCRTFFIKDKDGLDKVLIIDETNWADAMDSWRQVWEKQQKE